MAPVVPLKTAHLRLQAPPAIADCAPLLTEADQQLLFHLDTTLSVADQVDVVRRAQRTALTTRRLLEGRLQHLQTLQTEWIAVIRLLGPRDPPEQVQAEHDAFEAMNQDPAGLRVTVDRLSTVIRKLEFLDQDFDTMLAQLAATPVTSPAGGSLHGSSNSLVVPGAALGATAPPPSPPATSMRLPRLALPTFDGNPFEWFSFWDLFAATVDSHTHLSEVEKLAYLLSCLRGKAKAVASGYQRDARSYRALIDALQLQFGDVELLGRQLHLELRRLRSPAHTGPDLLRFHSDVARVLHQVRMTKVDSDHPHVLFALEEHLSAETRLMMRAEHNRLPFTTATDFCNTLLAVARLLTAVQPTHASGTPPPTSSWERDRQDRFTEDISRKGMQPKRNQASAGYGSAGHVSRPQQSSAFVGVAGGAQRTKGQIQQRKMQPCAFCGGQHWHKDCTGYKTVVDRRTRAAEIRICFKCLKAGHFAANCPGSGVCRSCKGSHHTLLCNSNATRTTERSSAGAAATAPPFDQGSDQKTQSTVTSGAAALPSESDGEKAKVPLLLWQTARVFNPSFTRTLREAKAFLDQGSHGSFIAERLAKKLGLEQQRSGPLIIHGVGDVNGNAFTSAVVSLGIRLNDGSSHIIEARTLPSITAPFLHAHITDADLPSLWKSGQPELAVPLYRDAPEILIGSNFIPVVDPHIIKRLESGFTVYESGLGPLVGGCGMVPEKYRSNSLAHSASVVVGTTQFRVEDFWELDVLGINSSAESVEDDERALTAFNASVVRLQDGRYSVSWPWKVGQPCLATNFGLCVGRLQSLLRSLSTRPERRQLYHDTFAQQLKAEVIERAPLLPTGPLIHYIPHQAVWNEEKKKLRVVYDASASAPRGQSLNDNLLRGPVFLPDLVGQLLRLRHAAVALVADVEKAFLQVQLNPRDRDVTRFLWVENAELPISPLNPLVSYRFRRVPFGVVSSPFLLAATILYHLRAHQSPWAKRIAENIYVDNVLLTAASTAEGQEAYLESKRIFAEAHMNLRDFQSNDAIVNAAIPPEDRHGAADIKVLGVRWATNEDTLSVGTKSLPDGPLTKRRLLRFIAQQFDPLGYMAPALLLLKILLQDVSREVPGWDATLPPERVAEWEAVQATWMAEDFVVPRSLPRGTLALHTFVDASTRAYAAVVFLKGDDKSVIVYAKSRLCPMKGLTVPRLELLAALIGTRATQFVAAQLHLNDAPRTLWSDSKCVLAWIRAPGSEKFPRFVQNRLAEIRQNAGIKYAYVPTDENPADVATRGMPPSDLRGYTMWWYGPPWLAQGEEMWPETPQFPQGVTVTETEEGFPYELVGTTSTVEDDVVFSLVEATRFSGWTTLLDAAAWALRFIGKILHSPPTWLRGISLSGPLNAADRQLALRCLLRQAQSGTVSTRDVLRWELKKDEHGLWRCGGRLTETTLPRAEQHPVFLPRRSPITLMLIMREHRALFHGGAPATLTRIRQHYWIPHGRRAVKAAIAGNCTSCRRWRAKPFALPPMPSLPATRVQPAPAFDCTGVDLLGPLLVRSDGGTEKRWLTLFTCLVTRAVHLEVTENLSALSFVDAFRRFFGRRGLPREMLSDNGTNLALTAKALKGIPETRTLSWTFITAMAPWQGGVYERIVGLTKACLRRAIGRRLLSDAELRTLAVEVEAVLNERPLTYVDSDGLSILRPVDYLRPRAHLSIRIDSTPDDSDPQFDPRPPTTRAQLIEQWGRAQSCRDKFWSMWQREYLQLLRERSQRLHRAPHAQTRRSPRVGEVVLLEDTSAPRGTWRLARVTALPLGAGNAVRTARIRTSNGRSLERTIAQLYPLEISEELETDQQTTPDDDRSVNAPDAANPPPQHHMVTRSMVRDQQQASTVTTSGGLAKSAVPFFLLAVLALAGPAIAMTTTAQICPYRHTGVYMQFPQLSNCSRHTWAAHQSRNVAVYRRSLVAINATYCSKIERTICTWAFLRWSLSVTNDSTVVQPVPVADCLAMHLDKRLGDAVLAPSGNPSQWATNHATSFSFSLFGSRCTTTTNYILEEGVINFFNGSKPLSAFTRTRGCIPRSNKCYTKHETIVWTYEDFSKSCRYRLVGTYPAQVTHNEVFIETIQSALVRASQPPKVATHCGIPDAILMENDFVVSFSAAQGPFRERGSNASEALRDQKRSFLAEGVDNEPDPENSRFQYLHDLEVSRNAQRWCESHNVFIRMIRWISLQDATAAARMLLGRNDVAAHYVGEDVMVTKCVPAMITKEHVNHEVAGHCYEKMPVTVGNTLAFIQPHTHDLILHSRRVPCPWVGPTSEPQAIRTADLYHLTEEEHAIVFNATKAADITTELLQLGLDRLGRGRVDIRNSDDASGQGMSSAEELLNELGHAIETTTDEIVDAIEAVTSRWKAITAGVALLVLLPALYWGIRFFGCCCSGRCSSCCHVQPRRPEAEVTIRMEDLRTRTPASVEHTVREPTPPLMTRKGSMTSLQATAMHSPKSEGTSAYVPPKMPRERRH